METLITLVNFNLFDQFFFHWPSFAKAYDTKKFEHPIAEICRYMPISFAVFATSLQICRIFRFPETFLCSLSLATSQRKDRSNRTSNDETMAELLSAHHLMLLAMDATIHMVNAAD